MFEANGIGLNSFSGEAQWNRDDYGTSITEIRKDYFQIAMHRIVWGYL